MRPASTSPFRQIPRVLAFALPGFVALGCEVEPQPDASWSDEDALQAVQEGPASPKIRRVSLLDCAGVGEAWFLDDRRSFRVDFDGFSSRVTRWQAVAETECTVALVLEGADGVAYAPSTADVVLNGDGANEVTLTTEALWSGSEAIATKRSTFARLAKSTVTHVVDDGALWSACTGQRELRLKTKLRVRSQSGSGHASIDALANLKLQARRCADVGGAPLPDASVVVPVPVASDGGASLTHDGSAPLAPESLQATVDQVRLSGPACTGAKAAEVSTIGQGASLDVRFNGFTGSESDRYPDCELRFVVTPPAGYRAAIESFVVDGRARLPADGLARLEASHWPSGRAQLLKSRPFEYQGPREESFTAVADFSGGELAFGDCRPEPMTLLLATLLRPGQAGGASFEVQRLHSLKFKLSACP